MRDTVVTLMPTPPLAAGKRSKRKPTQREGAPPVARWLLLIHQIPPKPDYLRVKIGRRLQRVGAVAIKNSVYVLPPSPEAHEDFQWIVREIEEGGGEAFVSEASLVGEGLTDDAVRA
ncbi:MAG TPA: Chromate resistance protein ChrB, partial [Chloroflexota bacterium]